MEKDKINNGALHPYSITFDSNGNIYVSFQNSNSILRFLKDEFSPLPFPKSLTDSTDNSPYQEDDNVDDDFQGYSDVDDDHSHDDDGASMKTRLNEPVSSDNHIHSTAYRSEAIEPESRKKKHKKKNDGQVGKRKYFNDLSSINSSQLYAGTFVQFGSPGKVSKSGLRGIEWVQYDYRVPLSDESSRKNVSVIHSAHIGSDAVMSAGRSEGTDSFNHLRSVREITPSQPNEIERRIIPTGFIDSITDHGSIVTTHAGNGAEVQVKTLSQLWIAHEDLNHVFIVDEDGYEIARLHVVSPISLCFDSTRGKP
jgi:hypothetical protein